MGGKHEKTCNVELTPSFLSDMRRACQVFRLEELAEKLGFELTLDMLGDNDVAGTTQGSKQIRSAAAVLKNHPRSYMKQARKAGMSLLQRLGTDAYYAFNCAVQDLTPKCMHWITVLGNVVFQAHKRRDSCWKSTPIQGTHVPCGLRSRPDANPRGWRQRPVLVQESVLQGESLRSGYSHVTNQSWGVIADLIDRFEIRCLPLIGIFGICIFWVITKFMFMFKWS